MQLKKIRLLHLLKFLDIGGIEKSTITFSNIFADKINFVGIFSPKGRFTKENIISEKVHLFNDVKGTIGINKYFFTNLFYLIRIINGQHINIIFYHFRIYLPIILIIKILFPKINVVYVAHSNFNDFLNYLIPADNYIAVSKIAESDLIKFGKSNISLITHGINIRNNVTSKNSEIKTIGYIGRFEKNKGIDVLLNAFKELDLEHKRLTLKLIGEGSEENFIHSFIGRYNLQDNIVLVSPIIREENLFEGIDLLVFPSTSIEGFGLIMLEAMNFGIPVIASDLIKQNSLIEDFKTGIYFKNGNAADLAAKLKLLIEDENSRQNISTKAREKIKLNYNLDNTISGYLKFLDRL